LEEIAYILDKNINSKEVKKIIELCKSPEPKKDEKIKPEIKPKKTKEIKPQKNLFDF
jgi:hypothetical protein